MNNVLLVKIWMYYLSLSLFQSLYKSAKSQLNYYENYIVESGINKINPVAPIKLRALLFSLDSIFTNN